MCLVRATGLARSTDAVFYQKGNVVGFHRIRQVRVGEYPDVLIGQHAAFDNHAFVRAVLVRRVRGKPCKRLVGRLELRGVWVCAVLWHPGVPPKVVEKGRDVEGGAHLTRPGYASSSLRFPLACYPGLIGNDVDVSRVLYE